ncbi:hypothetical protein Hanom_Chr00s168560g01827841 [Helianthus anomalus]
MSPMVRSRHGEVTAELAWSGSGSRSEITPAVGRTVHLPPLPQDDNLSYVIYMAKLPNVIYMSNLI